MNLDHKFTVERALASHCSELLAKSHNPEDCARQLADFFAEICGALPGRLQPLLVGKRTTAHAGDPEAQTAASLMQEIGNQAANYLVDFGSSRPKLLISFDIATAVSLTDRLFGGTGHDQVETPATLPMSASMALERIARATADVFSDLSGSTDAVPQITADSAVGRLQPFPRGQYCSSRMISVEQEGFASWTMRFVMLETGLQSLMDIRSRKSIDAAPVSAPSRAQSEGFGSIPLELCAVLAELQIPLAKLSSLTAGDVLPFAPARAVPLRIAGRTLASGTIGTVDERVAIRLTTLS